MGVDSVDVLPNVNLMTLPVGLPFFYHFLFILFKKQKLTYNRLMKLTIEQTNELKTYLKDKTY
ncbi:hypothetical protein, partial [Streptococcus suis]|uniref:hypothetical protein n=1 Tax=Streptococcus suis TaxID=1307 RepID=UPI001EE07047